MLITTTIATSWPPAATFQTASKAIDYYEQALAIAREVGGRYIESLTESYFGFALLDDEKMNAARDQFIQAASIANEIANPECRSEAGYGLALSHFGAGDLAAANTALDTAAATPYPRHGPRVAMLRGVIALRQGNSGAATAAFREATTLAQTQLGAAELVDAREALALATAGLALLAADTAAARRLVEEAADAYRAARAVTTAPGIVARALRLLDALAVVDGTNLLDPVRVAAAR